MKFLIKNARILAQGNNFHGKKKDILISDGIIEKISDNITDLADEVITNDNLHISIGWIDIYSNFSDPGYEQRETIETGVAAAVAGGFTDVMLVPNTKPPISTKSQVENIIRRAIGSPVNIHPIGAISKEIKGKELAEMYDLHAGGAKAFSDGEIAIQDPGLLLKALQYIIPINGTIIQIPDDRSISANGFMNEGITSTQIGLSGKPAMAEEIMIARDIELLRYTNSKLHITGVSTAKGISLITQAKKEGLQISCSATPYHCHFSDEDLEGYDSNLKVNPPLRTLADVKAIREALKNEEIDCIASHHTPMHIDDKMCDFENALSGMEGLETVFSAMNTFYTDKNSLINQLTITPRKIFGIEIPKIEEGSNACLTLFDPDCEFIINKSMIRSRSHNNAFIGKKLKGRVIGTINNNKVNITR